LLRCERVGVPVERNLRHLVNTIYDLMERRIGFRVLTASGRLVFGIFAVLAEFERELIRERTNCRPFLSAPPAVAWAVGPTP
jgi:DNA invertase Pin-like site-specific DNA recombinase